MKKKNGFFAISIVFSFFVVFLMLITMNLTRYAQNRILLAQVKNDIKNTAKLKVENRTLVCKRADITTLHTAYCDATLCEIDQTKNGEEAATKLTTFGNTYSGGNTTPIADWYNPGEVAAISGNLKIGDAFDCDVNKDGTYDPTTERFYYIAEQGDRYVLLYSESLGLASYGSGRSPSEAIKKIPTTEVWKNVNLSNPKRVLVDDSNLDNEFNYGNRAARLMTKAEFEAVKAVDNHMFLRENSIYFSSAVKYFWLETPHSGSYSYIYIVQNANGVDLIIDNAVGTSIYDNQQVRPVIEVPKDRVQKDFN